jgi:hypothetical protein
MATFRRGREFAAWLASFRGNTRLAARGRLPLLIIGGMTFVRWAVRKGAANESWLNFRYLIDRKRYKSLDA